VKLNPLAAVLVTVALGTSLWARPNATASPQRASCGVERWNVKTLTDRPARTIDLRRVEKTTVWLLRQLPRPSSLPSHRLGGPERTVYRVRADLVAAKLEEDEDIHLVIADPEQGAQMIVEFPDPGCTRGATPAARSRMRRARASFIRECGPPPSSRFVRVRGRATISGVGFFDFLHGQRGVAPNGIELHPVTRFAYVRCSRLEFLGLAADPVVVAVEAVRIRWRDGADDAEVAGPNCPSEWESYSL
jgi:hypothetical protein